VNISFIIIGKNTSKTLDTCITSLQDAVLNTPIVSEYEIIYVDSKSTDDSVKIAKKYDIELVKIINGYTTASLGRYLGKKYAKYNNFVFIDSDMYLDINWLNNSLEYYEKYGAIIGERHEKLYKNDIVFQEIPYFYGIEKVEIATNIGGFLMIKKEIIEDINYSPIIKNEEEKDFYSKFLDKNKIYKIPEKAYIHNNRNLSASRIKDYLHPFSKNGYILSLYNSIKSHYFLNYITLQKNYVLSMFVSILFYTFLLTGYYIGLVSILLIVLNGKKRIKGSLMTALFFPYKLIMTLVMINKKYSCKYIYKKETICLDI